MSRRKSLGEKTPFAFLNYADSCNRSWQKIKIFYLLILNQWLPLSEEHFPDLVSSKKELFTFTKAKVAVTISFGAIDGKDDPPITIRRLHYQPGDIQPIFKIMISVTPKFFNFIDNYTKLNVRIKKLRTDLTLDLKTGDINLIVITTNLENIIKTRDNIAKFANINGRLPCYSDLKNFGLLIQGNSYTVSNAVTAGYLKKVRYNDPRHDYIPGRGAPYRVRTLYMPLYPEIFPGCERPQSYEKFDKFQGEKNCVNYGEGKGNKEKFEELAKL